MPVAALLRERPESRLIESPDDELFGIQLPPGEGPSLTSSEYRIWFDPGHGFAFRRLETWHHRFGHDPREAHTGS